MPIPPATETGAGAPAGAASSRPPRRRARWRDPRLWLGLIVTLAAMGFALRGVSLGAVVAEFRRANLALLLGLSIPAYLLMVYLRALRWRHLTRPIQPMSTGPLFRAVAVGFMANNLFPLRMGEFVRSWYLARETGASAAAVFGTVVLERVVDTVMVIGMALGVAIFWGGRGGEAWWWGAALLAPVAVAPVVCLVCLRLAPERVLGLASRVLRPLPERLRARLLGHLEGFRQGLAALRGGSHLFWIACHSLSIWLVAGALPMLAGLLALGIDLGSPGRLVAASWVLLAAIGIAVALPSAPGFFGVYHSACRLVLERFGIPAELAVALGTLLHAVFWVTLTGLGLAVAHGGRTTLGELDEAAGG